MDAILITAEPKTNKTLYKLAKQLNGNIISINKVQYKDFALGYAMENMKTNQTIRKKEIMKKLKH